MIEKKTTDAMRREAFTKQMEEHDKRLATFEEENRKNETERQKRDSEILDMFIKQEGRLSVVATCFDIEQSEVKIALFRAASRKNPDAVRELRITRDDYRCIYSNWKLFTSEDVVPVGIKKHQELTERRLLELDRFFVVGQLSIVAKEFGVSAATIKNDILKAARIRNKQAYDELEINSVTYFKLQQHRSRFMEIDSTPLFTHEQVREIAKMEKTIEIVEKLLK